MLNLINKTKLFNRIISIALIICLLFAFLQTNVAYAASITGGKKFYTTEISDDLMKYFKKNIINIAPIISNDLPNYGTTSTQLTIGSPISLDGYDNYFYLPLLSKG